MRWEKRGLFVSGPFSFNGSLCTPKWGHVSPKSLDLIKALSSGPPNAKRSDQDTRAILYKNKRECVSDCEGHSRCPWNRYYYVADEFQNPTVDDEHFPNRRRKLYVLESRGL
jgi:hypothetical protein